MINASRKEFWLGVPSPPIDINGVKWGPCKCPEIAGQLGLEPRDAGSWAAITGRGPSCKGTPAMPKPTRNMGLIKGQGVVNNSFLKASFFLGVGVALGGVGPLEF